MSYLKGIDTIDWSRYVHAGGVATDLPRLLTLLASPNPYVLSEAHDALTARLCPDGSVYAASVAAVPFLIDLLADPAVRAKDRLAVLLRVLAKGHAPLDAELHPDAHFHARKQVAFQLRAALESGDARATRSAVLTGAPVYLQQLRHVSAVDRVALYALLGECREHRQAIDAVLWLWLPREQDASARMACLQALIALWQRPGSEAGDTQPRRDSLRQLLLYMSGDATEAVRVRLTAHIGLVALADDSEVGAVLHGLSLLLGTFIHHEASAAEPEDSRDVPRVIRAVVTAGEAHPAAVLAWLLERYDWASRQAEPVARDWRLAALMAAGDLCQRFRLPVAGVAQRAYDQLRARDSLEQRSGAELLPTLGRQALALAEVALAGECVLAPEVAAILRAEIHRQRLDVANAQTLRGGRAVADEPDLDRIVEALERRLADAVGPDGEDASTDDDPDAQDGPSDIWACVNALIQLEGWLRQSRADTTAQTVLDRLRPRLIAVSARACELAEGTARACGASAHWRLTGQVEPALSTLSGLLDDGDLLLAVVPLLAELGPAAAPALPDLRRLLNQPQRPVRLDDRGDRVLWDEALCEALTRAIRHIASTGDLV